MTELDEAIYGINADLEVYCGYDEKLTALNASNKLQDWQEPGDVEFASKATKLELADRMIALWTAYKNNAI